MHKEAKFILDKPKATTLTHIFLKFACKDAPLRYSTQEKINPEDWDATLQRALTVPKAGLDKKENAEYLKKNRALNTELDRLYRIVESYVESCRIMVKKDIYRDELRKELASKSDRKERHVISDTNNFFTAFGMLIKLAEQGKLLTPKDKKKYSEGTLKNWRKTKERLSEYNPNMTFDSITLQTYTGFINFCNTKGYLANYTGLLVKDWKTIMGLAFGEKWHTNLIYKHEDFKVLREVSEQVYLNEDEILLLSKVDLSEFPSYWEIIRDRFIINLYNGLRVSDMKTLSIDNIAGGLITHINQKTSKKVVIPVHDLVTSIIKKYDGQMPRQYHQNVVNRKIKKIAEKAGLVEKIHYSRIVGGVTKKFEKLKWQMITNHTSRRSMATNLLKHVSPDKVMPITGMSLKTLMLYNKITAEDNARGLQDISFFKTQKVKK